MKSLFSCPVCGEAWTAIERRPRGRTCYFHPALKRECVASRSFLKGTLISGKTDFYYAERRPR
jgi:hypothetical protein